MPEKQAFTIRLFKYQKDLLDATAKKRGLKRSHLIAQIIDEYMRSQHSGEENLLKILSRMERQLEVVDQQGLIIGEFLRGFITMFLAHAGELDESEKASRLESADQRTMKFLDNLAKTFAERPGVIKALLIATKAEMESNTNEE